jgi:hypothetical protein
MVDRRWVIFRRARIAFDDLVLADEDGIAFSGFVGLGCQWDGDN